MKQSVSSVLAERRRQRRAVTPGKVRVRYVKFTPEEMAIDAADVDASKAQAVISSSGGLKPSGSFKPAYVRLDNDVAKVFRDSGSVNRALRKLIEAMPAQPAKRRKTG
jgi:hypothetical protein